MCVSIYICLTESGIVVHPRALGKAVWYQHTLILKFPNTSVSLPQTQGSSVSVWVFAGMLELCQPCSDAANPPPVDPVHSSQRWQDFQVQDPHSLLRLQTLQTH